MDLVSELLKNGWAKLKDLKRDPTEEDLRRRDLEAEAKAAGKGIWNPHGPKVSKVFNVIFFFDGETWLFRPDKCTTRCLKTRRAS